MNISADLLEKIEQHHKKMNNMREKLKKERIKEQRKAYYERNKERLKLKNKENYYRRRQEEKIIVDISGN